MGVRRPCGKRNAKKIPEKTQTKKGLFLFFSSIQYSTASHEIKAVCDSTYSCRRYPFFALLQSQAIQKVVINAHIKAGISPSSCQLFIYQCVKKFFAIIILRHQKHLTNCYTFLFRKFQVNKSMHLDCVITRVRKQ